MADIRATGSLLVDKSSLKLTIPSRTTEVTMAGSRFIRNCQAIGTTYEAVSVGDLASAGWAMITNLDATNYVDIGLEVSATFYPFLRIKAGQTAGPFPLAVLTLFGRANGSAVNVDICITEA